MIRLAARLIAGGGRETLVRLFLTAAGLALAVTMLLVAAVVLPALRAHDVRRGWMETGFTQQTDQPEGQEDAQDRPDPLLWRLMDIRFDGRDLVRVDVAAEGPDAPVPPGLTELPGPGEVAVSPALDELLRTTDVEMLGDRFPGDVTGRVGRDALASPDDLVAVVGHAPNELRTEPDVVTVHGIETSPVSHNLTRTMRITFVVGGIGLLAPVIVFVATATRLAAARRERRLAAMRLAGATQRQIGVVAATEAALAAAGGTAAGFGLFFAVRSRLAEIPIDGASFYPSDLRLSWGWAAVIALGVPALAAAAALVSLRRLRISALGVARQGTRARPTPRPLALVGAGVAGLLASQATLTGAADVTIALAIGAAFVLMILGIVLSGPWLTSVVARAIGGWSRRPAWLLAARRLQDNPAAGFRAISGLILAVFVATVFSAFASSALATQSVRSSDLAPGVVTAGLRPQPSDTTGSPDAVPMGEEPRAETWQWPQPGLAATEQMADEIGQMSGVRGVVTAHALPEDPAITDALATSDMGRHPDHMAMNCVDAAAIGIEDCQGTTVVSFNGNGVTASGVTIDDELPEEDLADLEIVGVAAITDGRLSTIERVRTQLERGLPGSLALTQPDIDAQSQETVRTIQRISNIALSVTLVIAGCSLAVAVAAGIVERKQPFALLRLAGTRLSELRWIVMAEAAAPLLAVAAASVGLGLGVTALALETEADNPSFVLPQPSYWLALAAGLAMALLVVLATVPLLSRLTSLDSIRFE